MLELIFRSYIVVSRADGSFFNTPTQGKKEKIIIIIIVVDIIVISNNSVSLSLSRSSFFPPPLATPVQNSDAREFFHPLAMVRSTLENLDEKDLFFDQSGRIVGGFFRHVFIFFFEVEVAHGPREVKVKYHVEESAIFGFFTCGRRLG